MDDGKEEERTLVITTEKIDRNIARFLNIYGTLELPDHRKSWQTNSQLYPGIGAEISILAN